MAHGAFAADLDLRLHRLRGGRHVATAVVTIMLAMSSAVPRASGHWNRSS